MISRLSDVNFCPTDLSKQNLINEKVQGECFVTGNTILDGLLPYKTFCEYSDKILVTLHRRENHLQMDRWFEEVNALAERYREFEFILPIHPNPAVQRHRHLLTHLKIVEPLPHHDLLHILTKSKLVISDSGGLQEEGSFFNKKIIVCRKTKERPEGIATGHLYICRSPDFLRPIFDTLIRDHRVNSRCPYGDGSAAEKILKIIHRQ